MAAPSFANVKAFAETAKKLRMMAAEEFADSMYEGMDTEDVVELASEIAAKYRFYGMELGAQWYDYCAEIAGVDVDPADLPDEDAQGVVDRARNAADTSDGSLDRALSAYIQAEVQRSIRETGNANLWRDYERGTAGGKWCRVPVGDTCAWCLMLASQGAWYLSEKSALRTNGGDRYHDNCDCVAVYHADAESIAGYTALEGYKERWYAADNARIANSNGRKPYSDELARKVDDARARHNEAYESGETDVPWQSANETLIVMRDMYGMK